MIPNLFNPQPNTATEPRPNPVIFKNFLLSTIQNYNWNNEESLLPRWN